MSLLLIEKTGRLLLAELKKFNADTAAVKKLKPEWKNRTEITRLTVWSDKNMLAYAKKHNLIRYEDVESKTDAATH